MFNPDEFPKNIVLLSKNEVYKPVYKKKYLRYFRDTAAVSLKSLITVTIRSRPMCYRN